MNEALRKAFDRVAESYHNGKPHEDESLKTLAEGFCSLLEDKRGHMLSLGCGIGDAFIEAFLERNWRVLGVDFSPKMLVRANEQHPRMKTMQADFTALSFNLHRFDAITMVSSLYHIPRTEQAPMLSNIFAWLNPGGFFVFNYATESLTGEDEFDGDREVRGEKLFYSHKTPGELYIDLKRAGFVFISGEYHNVSGDNLLWVTVQKPV